MSTNPLREDRPPRRHADEPRQRRAQADGLDVDRVSEGSFPASDPPSTWWGGSGDPVLKR